MGEIKRVLTIAGSDSGGGAGIQADLKTFQAFGVYGMSVITAVTAQNTRRVYGIESLPARFVGLQMEAVLTDIGVDAIKTGMLSNAAIIHQIVRTLQTHRLSVTVCDPVMVAKSGDPLLEKEAVEALRSDLLPHVFLVTPNLPEAEILAGFPIDSMETMKEAARSIHALGVSAVLIKGGHLQGDPHDLLFDGKTFTRFPEKRIDTPHTHGTGCTFSAAITANLAKGIPLIEAIRTAKSYITEAIRRAFPLGKGHGPVNHFIRTEGLGNG